MKKGPMSNIKAKQPEVPTGFFVQGISAKAAKQPTQTNPQSQQNLISPSLSTSQVHKVSKPSNPQKGVPLKSSATKSVNKNDKINNGIHSSGKKGVQEQQPQLLKIDNSQNKNISNDSNKSQILANDKNNQNSSKKNEQHDNKEIKSNLNNNSQIQIQSDNQNKDIKLKNDENTQQNQQQQQQQVQLQQNEQEQQQQNKEIINEQKEPIIGKVIIKYNHYNNEFEIINGKLNFSTIDEQYCFSFVFKGNYHLQLKHVTSKEYQASTNKIFENLVDGQTYIVEVQEDPEEADKEISRPYYAPKKEETNPLKKNNNNRINQLTDELKGMSIEELKQKGDKYKEIIEARDLEDVLYN